jgi:hypothetical protein
MRLAKLLAMIRCIIKSYYYVSGQNKKTDSECGKRAGLRVDVTVLKSLSDPL